MRICELLKANRLSLNIIKTEYMIIGVAQKLNQLGKIPGININNTLLKRVPFTKSLGIITDETLSWENNIEYISTKIKRGIGVLGRSKNILPKEFLNMLYKTLIEPYFRYGNTVWSQYHQTLLVTHQFCIGLVGSVLDT